MSSRESAVTVEKIDVSSYKIPTDGQEADGTYRWDHTTLVLVEVTAGGTRGLGYTYADPATALLIRDGLTQEVIGRDAMDVPACYQAMVYKIRNLGRPGITAMAISAVDVALWDLKARLLDVALVTLLGAARDDVPVYGSGGFTSYSSARLQDQLGGWVAEGIPRVKMKVGARPADDPDRVRAARAAIGPDAALYVDANGAYSHKQALAFAETYREQGVVWFEEPVMHLDLAGLHLLRDRAPAGMDIAAGEYGYDLDDFRRLLDREAVDVLQADASRCGGITGFLRAATLADAHHLALSAHCAPSLHVAPCCAIARLSPIEYFHDHTRIEHMLFDGAPTPINGALRPDRSRPGLGLEFKRADAARYAV